MNDARQTTLGGTSRKGRLITLVAVLAALLAMACGLTAAHAAAPSESAASTPRPVAVWRLEGGFILPGVLAIRPANLVVYSDGRAIADAACVLRLSPAELRDVVSRMAGYLSGQPATATPRPGGPVVADVPATVLGVRIGPGPLREVHIPALVEGGGYARELYAARDLMARLARRVSDEGTTYTASRVRLVAFERQAGEDEVRSWPPGVPEPPESDASVRVLDLCGTAARAVVRQVPHGSGPEGVWTIYHAPSGATLAVAWRYLLPDECEAED